MDASIVPPPSSLSTARCRLHPLPPPHAACCISSLSASAAQGTTLQLAISRTMLCSDQDLGVADHVRTPNLCDVRPPTTRRPSPASTAVHHWVYFLLCSHLTTQCDHGNITTWHRRGWIGGITWRSFLFMAGRNIEGVEARHVDKKPPRHPAVKVS